MLSAAAILQNTLKVSSVLKPLTRGEFTAYHRLKIFRASSSAFVNNKTLFIKPKYKKCLGQILLDNFSQFVRNGGKTQSTPSTLEA